MAQQTVVNGYTWQNVSVVLSPFGVTDLVTEITYDSDMVTVANFAAGNQAQLLGTGNVSYKGSITMYQDQWNEVLTDFPNIIGSLGFDIAITVTPTANSPILTTFTDTLYNVVLNRTGMTTKQGDTHIMITLPFIYFAQTQFQ